MSLELDSETNSDENWLRLRPILDEAMLALAERDRSAILLRFFENKSYAEIASLVGKSENATRMRIDRALDKLRAVLKRRGLASTSAALGALLSAQSIHSAPIGLAAQCASAVTLNLPTPTLFSSAMIYVQTMKTAKIITLGSIASIIVITGTLISGHSAEPVGLLASNTQTNNANTATQPAPEQGTSGHGSAKTPKPTSKESKPTKKPANETIFINSPHGILLAKESVKELNLSDEEMKVMAEAINRAWNKLDSLSAQNASVRLLSAGKLEITIQQFPQGVEVYDQLLSEIGATLGADRNKIFLGTIAESLEHNLKYCGAGQRTFTIEKSYNDQGEFTEYKSVDTWTSAYNRHGRGNRRFNSKADFASIYPALSALWPSGF